MRRYVKRYVKRIRVRMDSRLMDKVNDYQETEGIKDRSKAIRTLIEIGLSLPPPTLPNGGSPSEKQTSNTETKRKFFHNEYGERIPY